MSSGPVPLPEVDQVAGLVCDLDGVVYRGPTAVPHAVEALRAVTVPIIYATNNAARPPAVVAAHLRELGLDVDEDQVLTSFQARESLPWGARESASRLRKRAWNRPVVLTGCTQ